LKIDTGQLLTIFPPQLRGCLGALPWERVEEIRLRGGRPVEIVLHDGDWWLGERGELLAEAEGALNLSPVALTACLELVTKNSLYALEEELRGGYVTVEGGHRIGLVGRAIVRDGKLHSMREIGGLNVRVAREVVGAAAGLFPRLYNCEKDWVYRTLIISPPRCGKTTILRDLVRQVSDGANGIRGRRVGLVDERSELAGTFRGLPQRQVGLRTDVLDACPKAQGIMLLLRSMSPEVIAVDEIGRREDVEALGEALNAGVGVLATAHAGSLEELAERPILRELVEANVFQRFVLLSRREGVGTVEWVRGAEDL
jgi:stage III sporulation protein AA